MELETWPAPPGDRIPNHPHFPVLIYHDVEAAAAGPDAARALFADHGWGGSWVAGVFAFHHFHSTSHEVLAVVAGRDLEGLALRAAELDRGAARDDGERLVRGRVEVVEVEHAGHP